MNSQNRLASVAGFLFPALALVVMIVIALLTGRSTVPATQGNGLPTANAQTAASAQNSSAQNTNMVGSSTAGGTPQGMGNQSANAQAASNAASPVASPQPSAPAATGAGSTPPQAPATQTPAPSTTAAPSGTAVQASAVGLTVYTNNCVSCHGAQGAGVAGAFPPLAGDQAVLGSDAYLANVLLYGLQGQINVKGQNYNGVMPAWATTLSDAEIAAVITHIRSSWGNAAPVVTEATIATERGMPKTAAQVLSLRPQ